MIEGKKLTLLGQWLRKGGIKGTKLKYDRSQYIFSIITLNINEFNSLAKTCK